MANFWYVIRFLYCILFHMEVLWKLLAPCILLQEATSSRPSGHLARSKGPPSSRIFVAPECPCPSFTWPWNFKTNRQAALLMLSSCFYRAWKDIGWLKFMLSSEAFTKHFRPFCENSVKHLLQAWVTQRLQAKLQTEPKLHLFFALNIGMVQAIREPDEPTNLF